MFLRQRCMIIFLLGCINLSATAYDPGCYQSLSTCMAICILDNNIIIIGVLYRSRRGYIICKYNNIYHSSTRGKSRWSSGRVRRKRGGRSRAGVREKAKFLVDALAPDACNTYVHCCRRRRHRRHRCNRCRVQGGPAAAVISSHT